MRIKPDKAVCLVVDYQERLVPVIYENEQLIQNSSILIKGLNALEVPLVVTQQYTRGLGMTVSEIQEAAGTAEYLEKGEFSCYKNEGIASRLDMEKESRNIVILCGIEAHICVLQTAIDLQQAGFQTVVVQDCISSRKPGDCQTALQRLKREGAILTTYESLLYELLETSRHPAFKSISGLVK